MIFFLSLEVELKTFRTDFSFNSRASFCAAVFGLGKLLITPAGWLLTQQIKAIPTTTSTIIIIIIIFIIILLQLLRPPRVIRLISLAAISESQLVLLPQLIQEERAQRVLKTTNGTTFGFFLLF